jgi:RNA polymerase sigma-70 factor (ECF subfamily)
LAAPGFSIDVESTQPVPRVARGASVEEIEAVYRARMAVFVRVCAAILGDREQAIDAVQEGFAAAIRHRDSFRGDSTVEGWVWGVVINAARNDRRAVALRRARTVAGGREQAPPDGWDAGGAVGAGPLRDHVSELPERQRLVLFLRYYADLDYRAIASVVGISVGTVGSTLNAAHAALRHALPGGENDV